MSCSSCKQPTNNHELVSIYATACNGYHNGPSRKLCGVCLVGYFIPVFRGSTGKWEFGTVLSNNSYSSRNDHSQRQFQLIFTDDTKEWASVSADPYEAYTEHFNDRLDVVYSKKKTSGFPSYRRRNIFPRPSIIVDHPNQYQYLRRRNSYPNNISDEAHSPKHIIPLDERTLSKVIGFGRPDGKNSSQTYRSKAASSLTETLPSIDTSRKKKVGNPFPNNDGYHSPVIRRSSISKVVRFGSPGGSQISSLTSSSSPTSSSSSDSSRNDSASAITRTVRNPRYARLWTPREDKLLLTSVPVESDQLCWPKIALDIPGRTGKQCRERYLNHLGPHLKHTEWSALEDATIFRLHASQGSKWSQMVKLLPGRTDNGIKNRFHYLRRRFEKRMKSVPSSKKLRLLIKQIGKHPSFQSLSPDHFVTKDIAVKILTESSSVTTRKQGSISGDSEYKFGPFEQVDESLGCGRCGLIIPSKETGTMVCRQTGWCETCTGVSLAISDDQLRAIHLVRKRRSGCKAAP